MRTGCRETAGLLKTPCVSKKKRIFAVDMNWKFIIKWVVTFTVALVIYDLTGSFWMSLGILILVAIAESYIIDYFEKRKKK